MIAPKPRFCLVTPVLIDAAAFARELAAALSAADIASVQLRFAEADERTLINRAKALGVIAQEKGAAVLLDGHVDIVVRAGADGAHCAGVAALKAALPQLKPDRIAGAGNLPSRHDAMLAAEAGADYVMFGEPDFHGHRPSLAAVLERVDWWCKLFEIPCVGYATSLAEIAEFEAAGAEFIALGDFVFADPRGPAAAIADAAGQLRAEEVS